MQHQTRAAALNTVIDDGTNTPPRGTKTGTSDPWSRRQLLGGFSLLLISAATGTATRQHQAVATLLEPLNEAQTFGEARKFGWDDGMQVHVSHDAVFRIEESSGERRLCLFSGECTLITEAPAGLHGALQPTLAVVTPDAEIASLGGHCTVIRRSHCSVLEVVSGCVQAQPAGMGMAQRSSIVRGGEHWRAS